MNYKAELLEGYKAFRELPDAHIAATYSCHSVLSRVYYRVEDSTMRSLTVALDNLAGRYGVEVLGLDYPLCNPIQFIMPHGTIHRDMQLDLPDETAALVEARRAYVDWVINELS